MPYVTIAPSGTGLSSGGVGDHERAKRKRCTGLSISAARRQKRFLMAVRPDLLDGYGLALTFTMRDLPAGPEDLHEALNLFDVWARRRGMLRAHWVMELQKRGVPHFHLATYWSERSDDEQEQLRRDIVTRWVDIAGRWGARRVAQHVEAIATATGWAKYCAKHAARSVHHEQREGLPPGWDHSGRLWGKWETAGNEWPTEETKLFVDPRTYVELRRMLRSWRHADAKRALQAARASLRAAHTDEWRKTAQHHVRAATARIRATRRFHGPAFDPADRDKSVRASRAMGMREWVPDEVMEQLVAHVVEHAGELRPLWSSTGRRDRSAQPSPWRWRARVYEVLDDEELMDLVSGELVPNTIAA